ncbi:hypothetical protein B566_EDAN002941 [Ephemera danica]|nr:hypothetical protein B566_EDAN002941 [Ephemera danica]
MEVKTNKPKPPPKPKILPKPQGLQQRGTKPGRLRLHITRMFSISSNSSSNSQPSSPTVLSPHGLSQHGLGMAQTMSCENLPVSSKRSLGSVSSGGGNSSGEPSPDLTKRRQHWRARSDTKHVRQLLGQHYTCNMARPRRLFDMIATKKGAGSPRQQLPSPPPVTKVTSLSPGGAWYRVFRLPRLMLSTSC